MPEVRVAAAEDLPAESAKAVQAGGRSLALVHTGGMFYAIDGRCPHSGGPLGEGTVENGTLRCPWHERHFDPHTGSCLDHEQTRAVECYPARVAGSDVLVTIP